MYDTVHVAIIYTYYHRVIFVSGRLLDILAVRSRVQGVVLVNGANRDKDFRFNTGYVVQVRIANEQISL